MSASQREPIAVVGTGCRFPGGVQDGSGLWQLAADGRRTAGPVPADRWCAARLARGHDPDIAVRAGYGCFLDGDIWAWDPEAFSVAPIEQRWVDPQFRVLLEVAWEAVEHAGIPMDQVRGSRTGVYVGTYAPDNLFREARPVQDAPNSAYLFGNFTAGAAGRVAFAMDLRGPVMVVSTHCSSGLVALDTACGALTLGECDLALAGGVLLMVSPETHLYEAPLLLSGHGACHAFDARADGYVRGEGAGVLALKRLTDALRDGDRVLAVIRGSAVNNDGQASRLTAPSTRMQQQLFRRAVENAGIDPGEVGLVEAHGPGTAVGDPIEYTSIDAVYGQGSGGCALGSVKTNIGHSEPVSGIAGVIKAVESLRRGVIPPNQHFRTWNPSIPRDGKSRLFVPTELVDWPVPGTTRLAAVCSYGVTGTNAHVVLEAAPTVSTALRPRPGGGDSAPDARARLFLLSGNSPQALAGAARRLADWADVGAGRAVPLQDVAHTLALRRSHADHRLGVVARSTAELASRARSFAADETPRGVSAGVPVLPPEHAGPVFVFTGQGSQRPGMCRGLLATQPVFAAAVEELEPLIAAEAGFSLVEMLTQPDRLTGIDRVQPTLYSVQVALADLWRSWGVEPAAVIGQSLGEIAAATVIGALGREEGVKVICRRSALLATVSGGAMASVRLGAEETAAAIAAMGADGVTLAVLTSPTSTVVSGDAGQVAALVQGWEAAGVAARMIDVDVASHSPQVDRILTRLGAALDELPAADTGGAFLSTVTTDPSAPGLLDASYWVRNQRDPVRFHAAVREALARGHRLFVECTPHPLAVQPIQESARAQGVTDVVAVGTLRQGTEDTDAFLAHLAAVHCAGHHGIDFAAHYGDGHLADVPGTTWHRVRHGGDGTPYQLVAPHLVGATQHPLLGGHVADPDRPGRHLWQTPIGPRRLPWLADHRVAGVPVLPGTGFAEMVLAAGAAAFGTDTVAAEDLRAHSPLLLDPEPEVTTRLTVEDGQARTQILSGTGEARVIHAHATVRPLPAGSPRTLAPPATDGWTDFPPADLYRYLRTRHDVLHGPAFTAIERIQVHPTQDRAVSWLRVADSARVSAWTMTLHPALTDQLVQTVVAVWLAHHTLSPGPVVVAGFDAVRCYGPWSHARRAEAELDRADDLSCTASGRLLTDDGTVVAEIRGLRLANITPPEERFASRLSHLAQVPAPVPAPPTTSGDDGRRGHGGWLVVTDEDTGWAHDLTALLTREGAPARTVRTASLPEALDDPAPEGAAAVALVLGRPDPARSPAVAAREVVTRLAAVLQALSTQAAPPRIWVVWREEEAGLAGAGVPGLLRVAAYEHPGLVGSIEMRGRTAPQDILPDLLADRPVAEISWRHGVRHLARVRPGPAGGPVDPLPSGPVREDGRYLVTGGLGGLGLLTVRWLAERGAGRIVACGRGAPSEEARRELAVLRAATGARIDVLLGDIADPRTAELAVRTTADDGRGSLHGVFHSAGLVEDAVLTRLDATLTARVWRGKAEGAWALHRATAGHDLDLFVLYSSIAGLVGSPGQGAYAAANTFLDALAEYRRDRGLPATSIAWGGWSRVGRGRHLAQRGHVMISPEDGIAALERILTEGHRRIAYSPIDLDRWIEPFPALRDSPLLAGMLTTPSPDRGATPARDEVLSAGTAAERRRLLNDFITAQVRDLLGGTARHIGPHTSMVILGLDSLGAVQLQQRIRRGLGIDVKPGIIWVRPTAAGLTDHILDTMGLADDAEEHH
ncbi:SDR family NAD(P)-dependent oxidoreductase [Kitasatospora sp. NPDC005748]|uniref:SDR family NAD(P)-dependent oxidoreductase n=1 Tax=Kitasatospora sp. NPDC005748 TaxID=3157063 RepID=UPI0033F26BDD